VLDIIEEMSGKRADQASLSTRITLIRYLDAIKQAIEMPVEEQKERNKVMRERIASNVER
jgi:hypothetical protein